MVATEVDMANLESLINKNTY